MSRPDIPGSDVRRGPSSRPELSRPVAIARIGRGDTVLVEADAAERAPVAHRLDVPDVASLRCRWTLRPGATDGWFEADGLLDALVTRTCVVTLEPLEETVHETFAVLFVPEAEMPDEDDGDPDSPDLVPYDGVAIDLGDAAVEQLALALDPFPRVPEVARDGGDETPTGVPHGDGGDAAETRPNPFAVLLSRRDKG